MIDFVLNNIRLEVNSSYEQVYYYEKNRGFDKLVEVGLSIPFAEEKSFNYVLMSMSIEITDGVNYKIYSKCFKINKSIDSIIIKQIAKFR